MRERGIIHVITFDLLLQLLIRRFIDEFQWFLIALSVRPGKFFVISALVSCTEWAEMMIASSWGPRRLYNVGIEMVVPSLPALFAYRPGKCDAMSDHFSHPLWSRVRRLWHPLRASRAPLWRSGWVLCHR